MGVLTSRQVKEKAEALGMHLCGIASMDRFARMPEASHPERILPGARSVVVVARRFLRGTTGATSSIPYTIVRNGLSRAMDDATVQLSYFLEDQGYAALPTGAIEPCNYNVELGRAMGLVSLKHAALQAGLGVIGKNTLLLTPGYGNMVWLGAVITTAELEADPLQIFSPCAGGCRICLDACPVHALDGGEFMQQRTCYEYAFGKEGAGEWRIKCFQCRARCPHAEGYEVRQRAGA